MQTAAKTDEDYSRLLELMTAREYVARHEPHLFETFPDTEAALREDTEAARSVAAEFGIPPSPSGIYPFIIWFISNDPAHVSSRVAAAL